MHRDTTMLALKSVCSKYDTVYINFKQMVTNYPENEHPRTPFSPVWALPIFLNTNLGSISSGSDNASCDKENQNMPIFARYSVKTQLQPF